MDTNSESAVSEGVAETLPPMSVGKILSEARIRQGLSVADVAGRIKFAPRQVEALEADDFTHLPELAFVRGFVRSYARLLHVDEAALLNALPLAHQQMTAGPKDLAEVPFPISQSTRRINLAWLSAALGLAVILGIGVWLFQDKPVEKKATEVPLVLDPVLPAVSAVAAASSVAPAALAVSAVSAVPALKAKEVVADKGVAQGPIRLMFEGESWVDVKDKSGKTLLKQVNAPGTEQWISGRAPFSLVIGNASSVRLYYEGEEVDLDEFTDVEVARLILE